MWRTRSIPSAPLRSAGLWEILAGERDLSAARFVEIVLLEPEKGALARFGASGERPPREAFVVLHDRVAQTACEAIVALDAGAVSSWSEVPGVQAAITLDEYIECEQAVRADPRFREALARRGITNPELVLAEAWSVGGHAQSGEEGRRLAWTPCWFRDSLADNAYARPIEGLFTVVDLNTMEVLGSRTQVIVPVPPASGDVPRRPGRPSARGSAPARDRTAGGAELRGRGSRGALAEVALPRRVHPARGPRAAHACLPRPGSLAPGAAPRLLCRAGDPVRRSQPGALPHERLRHRRVRRRPDDQLAGAGLRLPGRDPLSGRRCARQRRRADRDPQRDLHARGGRRPALEAL